MPPEMMTSPTGPLANDERRGELRDILDVRDGDEIDLTGLAAELAAGDVPTTATTEIWDRAAAYTFQRIW